MKTPHPHQTSPFPEPVLWLDHPLGFFQLQDSLCNNYQETGVWHTYMGEGGTKVYYSQVLEGTWRVWGHTVKLERTWVSMGLGYGFYWGWGWGPSFVSLLFIGEFKGRNENAGREKQANSYLSQPETSKIAETFGGWGQAAAWLFTQLCCAGNVFIWNSHLSSGCLSMKSVSGTCITIKKKKVSNVRCLHYIYLTTDFCLIAVREHTVWFQSF